MKVELELKFLRIQKQKQNNEIHLIITIGQTLKILSDWSIKKQGLYPFMEKNIVQFTQDNSNYICFQVVNRKNQLLAKRTLFTKEAKNNEIVDIEAKNGQNMYQLIYKYKEIVEDSSQIRGSLNNNLNKTVNNSEQQQHNSGKLQILKLGVLMFNFAQRLDILVWLQNEIYSILFWKVPIKSFIIGIILTIIILNIKISILIGTSLLILSKTKIFKWVEKYQQKSNIHNRIILPKENLIFLQNSMNIYCQFFNQCNNFIISDDKTRLIYYIHLICKGGICLILLLFLINFQYIIVIALWTILFLASSKGNQLIKIVYPTIKYLDSKSDTIVSKFTQNFHIVLGDKHHQSVNIRKQYYFYHYERWWVGKEWVDCIKNKFSDENGKIQLQPKDKCPDNWQWQNQWKVQLIPNSDSQGYQYSNDLSTDYNNSKKLKTIRRRKWIRECVPITIKNK